MEDYKAAVDAAFKARSERIAEAEKKKAEIHEARREFLTNFQVFLDSVVMPVFEEFGRFYARDNYSYRIEKNQEPKPNETDLGPWARILFTPKGLEKLSLTTFPHLEVRANKDELVVELYELLKRGKKDELAELVAQVKIENADAALLRKHLVRMVTEILG
ncbi:hypothetical protein GIV21_04400 [Pseudomonas syringae]|uniref:hypothetical protein n=2 Tax=Pseudomonas TaxID=286 RepID=UPI00211BFBA0|nr:hypothetical protein [Pseudomonas alliivorans]MCF9017357.1 hypothetical protein [Pseudomonas syringae]MCQ9469817.1 hypothetical protein [Pseudomonas alliivorans]